MIPVKFDVNRMYPAPLQVRIRKRRCGGYGASRRTSQEAQQDLRRVVQLREMTDTITDAVLDAAASANELMLATLIAAGANVAATHRYGWTACHEAAGNSNERVLALVIAGGADVNKPDDLGSTPYHSAASNRNEKVMALLIAAGAQVDETACSIAVQVGNARVLALLLLVAPDQAQFCMAIATSSNKYLGARMLVAAGIACTQADIDRLPRKARRDRWQRVSEDAVGISRAHKEMQMVGFSVIRERASQICIALQSLRMPALQLCEIVIEDCVPFAARLDYYLIWNLVVAVKHFKGPACP